MDGYRLKKVKANDPRLPFVSRLMGVEQKHPDLYSWQFGSQHRGPNRAWYLVEKEDSDKFADGSVAAAMMATAVAPGELAVSRLSMAPGVADLALPLVASFRQRVKRDLPAVSSVIFIGDREKLPLRSSQRIDGHEAYEIIAPEKRRDNAIGRKIARSLEEKRGEPPPRPGISL
jgi:hypothetical protein